MRRVIDSGMTNPTARVWSVELSDGKRIRGTGDHPIRIDGIGWVRIDALRYGMVPVLEDTGCVTRQSSSTGSSSDDTPSPWFGQIESTSPLGVNTGHTAWDDFTRRSGNFFDDGTR